MRKVFSIFAALFCIAANAQDTLSISLEKDALMLDIPESMLGSKVMMSAKIASSTSSYLPVMQELSKCCIYRISLVDSSIVFTRKTSNYTVIKEEPSITRALENSQSQVVSFVFPVKSHKDSTFRIDATKLFDISNKNLVDMKGMSYSEYEIRSFSYSTEKSSRTAVENYKDRAVVRTDATFDLELRTKGLVFDLDDKYPVTFEIAVYMTPVEDNKMSHKLADPRIGTRNVPAGTYDAAKAVNKDEWIQRWDLSGDNTIDIYVDTLLTPAQRKAVYEGFDAWNLAFRDCGLGDKIRVMDYPRGDFRAEDPFNSIVTLSGSGTSLNAELLPDDADRIMATRFYIPSDYVSSVRKRSVFTISDVDPKFQPYFLSEEAVCEVLKADVIRTAGLVLGLDINMAGSYAYTPEQITDPVFTTENGFTASVTDNVLFNYFARPGDKERGVATVVDKIGVYDKYAISWIYADGKPSDQPEFFYAPYNGKMLDSRVRNYDLSNDSQAAFEAGLSHLYYVADHGAEWIADEDIPQSYRELFIDWLWLRGNNLVFLITSNVGAYQYNVPREDRVLPKYVSLSKDIQKESLRKAFEYYRNFLWLDKSKLVHIAGANQNTSDFSRANTFGMVNASFRFSYVAYAAAFAGSDYSVEEYMEDMEKQVFMYICSGEMPYGESFIVGKYISWLASNASLGSNEPVEGMSEISREYLERAIKLLKKSKGSFKSDEKAQIDYLIAHAKKKLQ